MQDYPWITSEREHFGKRGTDYDWSQGGVDAKFDDYRASREKIAKLGQQLNKKVLQMIDKAEEEYQELSGKKDIVSKDKAKIHKVRRRLMGTRLVASKSHTTNAHGPCLELADF